MPEDCAKKAITGDSLVFDYEVREFTLLDQKETNKKTKQKQKQNTIRKTRNQVVL